MASEPNPPDVLPLPRRRRGWRMVLVASGSLLALMGAGYAWLGTDAGRQFVVARINASSFDSGLKIRVEKIEGSLFGKLRLRELALSDGKGVFLSAPEVRLDWRPLPLLVRHLDIAALDVPQAQWLRVPQLKPGPPDQPLLPDMDIDIDRLKLGGLLVMPQVTGKAHLVTLEGSAHIADRRAQVRAEGQTIAGQGRKGGDRLALLLDAVPENNRLRLDARISSPRGGFITGLAGADFPIELAIRGKGDWAAWQGRLQGSAEVERLADLRLSARDGRFAITGPVWPARFMPGAPDTPVGREVQLALRAAASDRKLTLGGGMHNDRFRLGLGGLVDLGENAFDNLSVTFDQARPGRLVMGINGDGVAARIGLDGPFAAPRITYRLAARRLGMGQAVMDGLAASGEAAWDKDHWQIPLKGQVRRVTGVGSAIDPLLANLRLDGSFAFADMRLLSDSIRLRSDRVDATVKVATDFGKARYTAGLQGRIDDYRVDSVGIFALRPDIELKAAQAGAFRLEGKLAARSTRLLNDGLQGFLGGNALLLADVAYDSSGIASIERLSIASPAFRLAKGQGQYLPDGRLRFQGSGYSTRYGPLALTLSGSAQRPVARIEAARPGMGVGLVDVTATITGSGAGYRIEGRGESDYGPVEARLLALSQGGAMRLELQPGTRFSGVALTGALNQTRSGPFAGTLLAGGAGLSGRVHLSPLADRQRIEAHLRGNRVSLPGRVGFAADRAILDADIVLHDQPQITADMQLAGTQLGGLYISAGRARLDYRAGSGKGQILLEGRTRHPFRIAANVTARPRLWRANLKGRFNGIDIATREALRIVPENGGHSLRPAVLAVGAGTVRLAGHLGKGLEVRSRLENIDLALANPFLPGLGLSGRASGSLDFEQAGSAGLPHVDARLQVKDFTRTSLASTSLPVDIQFSARLAPDGGKAGAIIRRRGAVVGRMQLGLGAAGPQVPQEGAWSARLLAAPLSGGLRYNGPADVLFSLAALPDQNLRGAVGVAADIAGRLDAPQISGLVRANNLTYENGQFGTRLTRIQLSGRFAGDRLDVESLAARAGDGTVSGKGFVSLSSGEGFPVQLNLDMKRAQLASGSDLAAVATGQVRLVNAPGRRAVITGKLSLPETHYRIVRQSAATVATLSGVRRKQPLRAARITGDPDNGRPGPVDLSLDVDLVADNKVFVTGMGLNSEWAAQLHAGGTTSAPLLSGSIRLVRGTLSFAGRNFDLAEGRLNFDGDGRIPDMRIVATGDVEGVTTLITMTGSSDNPQIAFSSTPNLPRDELMARILFGNSVGQLSPVQAVQLAASLNALRGGKGGLNPLGVLQSSAGVDRLRILGADTETGRETSLALGKYIGNNFYMEIVTDARGYTAAQIEVSLSRALSVLSEVGSFGSSSLALRYRKDY